MRCRLLVSLALAVAAATFAAAQSVGTAPPPQTQDKVQRPPTFKTQANFVRVDAYPTSDGRPVEDLRAEDFEILEDGAPQAIEAFEHVVLQPAGPQAQRSEPSSVAESHQLAANPRNRVFILFLDIQHVSMDGSWLIREPLIRLIDRILGPDDLVGVMTPKMSAGDVVLARKTEVIASGLRDRWPWGERHTLERDELEKRYEACYPPMTQDPGGISPIVVEMTQRKRERVTLDSLRELVLYLRDVREERKAILTISEGWLLFRPNPALTVLRPDEAVPRPDPITVGLDGRLTTKDQRNSTGASKEDCDRDRQNLALIDNEQYFRTIIEDANRGNSSFYTMDPRGLAVFDNPLGPAKPPSIVVDANMLRSRGEALRTLAGATDGLAVLGSNDLDAGLKRISDDLTSYYLMGYYSTNAKLDGRFRGIKVRVKRPGVQVRARKGYRAATEAEVTAARAAAAPPLAGPATAVAAAMGALSRLRSDSRFRLNAVPIATAGSTAVATIWIAGELLSVSATDPWARGGTADIEVVAGGTTTTAKVTLGAGERTFSVPVTLKTPVAGGSLDVRAKLSGSDPSAERLADNVRVELAQSQPLMFRRGPATGNRLVPAASFQFSRTERVRFELPVAGDVKAGEARLLDKAGAPLTIPVTAGERTDAQSGQRWLTADLTLAALGAGDYAVELTALSPAGERRVIMTAIRVTR